ncbi:MAG: hypothetical protein ACRD9S_21945 [Pyrinomonadaceae bacterium]
MKRIQFLKLAWGAIRPEFAWRDQLYERSFSGNGEQARFDALKLPTRRNFIHNHEAT